MSRQTTNYGLTKPDYTDIADIEVVNSNMDIIDEALKVIDTKSNNVMSKNSSAWSSTVTYAVGQYCIYNNSLWKCLVQHSGQTPQEGTYWTRVSLDTLDSEINAINQNLSVKQVECTAVQSEYFDVRNVFIYRYGNVLQVITYIKCKKAPSNWVDIATGLPNGVFPEWMIPSSEAAPRLSYTNDGRLKAYCDNSNIGSTYGLFGTCFIA